LNFLIKTWVFCHFFEHLFLIKRALKRCSLSKFFNSSYIKTSFWYTLTFCISNDHYSCNSDPISWNTFSHIISITYKMICSGYLSTWNFLRILLNFHILNIHNLTIWHCNKRILRTSFIVSNSTSANCRNKRIWTWIDFNISDCLAIFAF
jgi:hypothetical protein